MASKRPWRLLAFRSVIATAAIGSWGCCSVKWCDTQPRNQLVIVLDADKVSADPIVVSQKARHEIVWRLPAESTIGHVEIVLAGKPAPFERCETVEGVCRIACSSGLCSSGPVTAAVRPPAEYGYVFARPGSAASLDPTIRIDP